VKVTYDWRFTNWVTSVVMITSRHGPHRKHRIAIVVVQLLQLPSNGLHNTVSNSNCIVVEPCLLRRCIAMAVVLLFVLRSLPSNGSVHHNNMQFMERTHFISVPLQICWVGFTEQFIHIVGHLYSVLWLLLWKLNPIWNDISNLKKNCLKACL
jgi:hypothetical protein